VTQTDQFSDFHPPRVVMAPDRNLEMEDLAEQQIFRLRKFKPEILSNGAIQSSEAEVLDLTKLNAAELSALTKAMHEARFPEVWDDPIVWLNPFTHNWRFLSAATGGAGTVAAFSGSPSHARVRWSRRTDIGR